MKMGVSRIFKHSNTQTSSQDFLSSFSLLARSVNYDDLRLSMMSIRLSHGFSRISTSFLRKNCAGRNVTQARWASGPSARQWSTPLARNIAEAINVGIQY